MHNQFSASHGHMINNFSRMNINEQLFIIAIIIGQSVTITSAVSRTAGGAYYE